MTGAAHSAVFIELYLQFDKGYHMATPVLAQHHRPCDSA